MQKINELSFLNIRIVQSKHGTSIDHKATYQTGNIE